MGIFKHGSETDSNTPADDTGEGPVTIEDRVEPGGEGSPGSNQAKTEPMSPTGTHSEPLAVPDLADMNVGFRDPQSPSHPAALGETSGSYAADEPVGQEPTQLSGEGTTPEATRPDVDSTTSTGRAPGPEQPVQVSTGTAHRAPGLDGTTPDGESVESDVSAGAARMGAHPVDGTSGESPGQGDDQSVPVPGDEPSPGTSEEHEVVSGIKLPEADEA